VTGLTLTSGSNAGQSGDATVQATNNLNLGISGNLLMTSGINSATKISGANVNLASVGNLDMIAGTSTGQSADSAIQATNSLNIAMSGNLKMISGTSSATKISGGDVTLASLVNLDMTAGTYTGLSADSAIQAGNNLNIRMSGNLAMNSGTNSATKISGGNVALGSLSNLTMTAGASTGQSADALIQASNNVNVAMSGNLKLDALTGGSNSSAAITGTNVSIGSAGARANGIVLKGGTSLVTGATPQVLHADAKISATGSLGVYLGMGGLAMTGGTASVVAGGSSSAQATAAVGLKGSSVTLDVSNLGNLVITGGTSLAQTGLSASNLDLSADTSASIVSANSFSPIIAGALTMLGGTATAGPSSAHASSAALIDGGTDLKMRVGTSLTLAAGTAVANGGVGDCKTGGGACANVSALISSRSSKDIMLATGDLNFTGGSATANGGSATSTAFAGTDAGSAAGTLATLATINALAGRLTLTGGPQGGSGDVNSDAAILSVGGIKITGHGSGGFLGLTINGSAGSGLFQNVLGTGTIIRLDGSSPPVEVFGGVSLCPLATGACSGGTFGSGFILSGAPPSNLDPLLSGLFAALDQGRANRFAGFFDDKNLGSRKFADKNYCK
jgi:hypothetical protein